MTIAVLLLNIVENLEGIPWARFRRFSKMAGEGVCQFMDVVIVSRPSVVLPNLIGCVVHDMLRFRHSDDPSRQVASDLVGTNGVVLPIRCVSNDGSIVGRHSDDLSCVVAFDLASKVADVLPNMIGCASNDGSILRRHSDDLKCVVVLASPGVMMDIDDGPGGGSCPSMEFRA